MGTFDGKTVPRDFGRRLTGGALGIGSATTPMAAEFALEGARVVIADVNAEAGQQDGRIAYRGR